MTSHQQPDPVRATVVATLLIVTLLVGCVAALPVTPTTTPVAATTAPTAALVTSATVRPTATINPLTAQATPHASQLTAVVPQAYRSALVYYTTMNRPVDEVTLDLTATHSQPIPTIRDMFISANAIDTMRADRTLPIGTVVLMEVYLAQRSADNQPLRDEQGRFVRGELLAVETIRKESAAPSDWSVGVFDPLTGAGEAFDAPRCVTCHLTARNGHDFIHTFRGLNTYVNSGNAAFGVCSREARESC